MFSPLVGVGCTIFGGFMFLAVYAFWSGFTGKSLRSEEKELLVVMGLLVGLAVGFCLCTPVCAEDFVIALAAIGVTVVILLLIVVVYQMMLLLSGAFFFLGRILRRRKTDR